MDVNGCRAPVQGTSLDLLTCLRLSLRRALESVETTGLCSHGATEASVLVLVLVEMQWTSMVPFDEVEVPRLIGIDKSKRAIALHAVGIH